MLQTGVFTAKKLFSIDRVFRNESLDATHLAEFHQVLDNLNDPKINKPSSKYVEFLIKYWNINARK